MGGSTQGNGYFGLGGISNDGDRVVFETRSTNLDPNDTGARSDVYVYELSTKTLTLASVDSSGVKGNRDSEAPVISGNGQFVVFQSTSTNLTVTDTNGTSNDIFIRDLSSSTTEIISVFDTGMISIQSDESSTDPYVSDDGNRIVFENDGTNWSPNVNETNTIYLRDRNLNTTTLVSPKWVW